MDDLLDIYENPSNVIFEEESFVDYRPGGFHPVAIGDSLSADRYIIYHKLGFGGSSTIWLARDLWSVSPAPMLYAMPLLML